MAGKKNWSIYQKDRKRLWGSWAPSIPGRTMEHIFWSPFSHRGSSGRQIGNSWHRFTQSRSVWLPRVMRWLAVETRWEAVLYFAFRKASDPISHGCGFAIWGSMGWTNRSLFGWKRGWTAGPRAWQLMMQQLMASWGEKPGHSSRACTAWWRGSKGGSQHVQQLCEGRSQWSCRKTLQVRRES